MPRHLSAALFSATILMFTIAVPASAQEVNPCNTTQSYAVRCFVRNAIATKILTVPTGMNITVYDNYAVAVFRITQDTNLWVMMLGTTSAIADAMPAKNADGTANEMAQTDAINSIVNSESLTGIIAIPSQITLAQLEMFAQQTVSNIAGFTGVSLSPGAVLRLIDSYIITATSSSGTINWTTVDTSLTTAVKNLISSGMVKMPAGVTQAQFTTFVEDVAHAIASYKSATGRKSL
jgi:hypothetical protein